MFSKKQRVDFEFNQSSPSNRAIQLITNHYHLDVPKCSVYHYDVKIVRGKFNGSEFIKSASKCPPKSQELHSEYQRSVIAKLIHREQNAGGFFFEPSRMTFLRPVFDGAHNLYTIRPIPSLGTDKNNVSCHYLKLEEVGAHGYRIRIRFATEVDFSKLSEYFGNKTHSSTSVVPQDAIRALDIILRCGPSAYQIPLGNCVFPKLETTEKKLVDIGKGKYIVSGHHQSIRKTASGLSLVIDKSSTVFYKACDLIDFVRNIVKTVRKGGNPRNMDPLVSISLVPNQPGIEANLSMIEKELMNLTIEVNHTPTKMKFKFRGFTRTSPSETFFIQTTDHGDRNISVADFFMEKYSLPITYKNLPCAIVGNVKRPSYLPLEVCQLVAKQQPRTLNQQELTHFIKSCAQDCDDRFKSINDSAEMVKKDNVDYLREFSIDLSNSPVQVEGFCLDVPKLSCKSESFTPESGKWSIKDKKISKGINIPNHRWFIVNFTHQSSSLINQFVSKLQSFGEDKGAQIGEPVYWEGGHSIRYDNVAVRKVLKNIYNQYRDRKIDLPHLIMFIITRSKDDSIYHEIKRYGDVEYGFNTQCVVESNLKTLIHDKGFFMLSNIFLKMNAKLGGTNNIIDSNASFSRILGSKSTIIMGADVTHPTDKMSYSIAACVASYDKNHTKYSASVKLQPRSKDEIIQDFPDMVYELMKNYISKNRHDGDVEDILPGRLIFYRDGVSDDYRVKVNHLLLNLENGA